MNVPRKTQAQQIAELSERLEDQTARLETIERQFKEEAEVRHSNHQMLSALHAGLMVPQPGQDGKSLLERMASVTVRIESGERTAVGMLSVAKWLVAIAAAIALAATILGWGSKNG